MNMLRKFFGPLNSQLTGREKSLLPLAVVILLLAAILRTQPHIANSTPFFAIAILVGFLFGSQRVILSAVLSVAAMFLADLVIGFHPTMVFVYVGIAIAALIGSLASSPIQNQKSLFRKALGAFVASGLASTVFFVVSNLGVWLVGGLYPKTVAGLVQCFVMAIPFFRNSLTTDLFFGTLFISVACVIRFSAIKSGTESATERASYGR